MFGYVRPDMGRLSKENREAFGRYYCGLCHSLRRRYAHRARLTLSFDCTFLALLLDSLEPQNESGGQIWCGKRRPIVTGERMDLCADVNVLLAYYNACDDEMDQSSLKSKGVRLLLDGSYQAAAGRHVFLDAHIEEYMEKLWRLERENCADPDLMSDQFGRLLRGVGEGLSDNEDVATLLYHLGRYIYLLDAVDDYEKDIKKGEYNVYYQKYGNCPDIVEKASFGLECHLSGVMEHFQKLLIVRNKELLDHIIYIGIIQYFLQERKGA